MNSDPRRNLGECLQHAFYEVLRARFALHFDTICAVYLLQGLRIGMLARWDHAPGSYLHPVFRSLAADRLGIRVNCGGEGLTPIRSLKALGSCLVVRGCLLLLTYVIAALFASCLGEGPLPQTVGPEFLALLSG